MMLECVKIKGKVLSDYVALGTYGEALWHYTCVCVCVCVVNGLRYVCLALCVYVCVCLFMFFLWIIDIFCCYLLSLL